MGTRQKDKSKGTTKKPQKGKPAQRAQQSIDYSPLTRLTPTKALAEIVGPEKLFHGEASKKVWKYVKYKGLQDRQNRMAINADPKLKAIFGGKAQVSTAEMTKAVREHLKP